MSRNFRPVLVRDLPVRIFHWSLVAAIATAATTGYLGQKNLLSVHVLAGYALAVLIGFRILWWFIGGRHSRLGAYPLSPRKVRAHLGNLLAGRSPQTAGHNPAGAWMILVLIALAFLLVISGLVTLGGAENLGPLHALVSFRTGGYGREIHETLAGLLMLATGGHLAGVFLETKIFGHPLLRAMTRGDMPVAADEAERGHLAWRGLLAFALVLAALSGIYHVLDQRPDARWRKVAFIRDYSANCADCHPAYHPSLRSGEQWARIMASLANHFGEDASIDAAARARIEAFLRANDASHFDTRPAVRIGQANSASLRMTETPFWKWRHKGIARARFRAAPVGSKSNCNACHKDAASGRFDAAAIHVPAPLKPRRISETVKGDSSS